MNARLKSGAETEIKVAGATPSPARSGSKDGFGRRIFAAAFEVNSTNASHRMNILVIGARAAGLKAACRAKRLLPDADVLVLEEGQYISYASCGLPYFLSADVEEFRQLTATPYGVQRDPDYFAAAKDVQVLTGVRAERIDTSRKTVICRQVASGKPSKYAYDHLILATGASPIVPDLKGSDLSGVYTFTRPKDAIELRQAASSNQLERVAIIGAGYIGCELCEAFKALWGIETVLFENEPQVLPEMLDPEVARVVELELERQGIESHLSTQVSEIQAKNDKLNIVAGGGSVFEDFDRVVLCAGVQPRTELAFDAGIAIGLSGGIAVNERMQTNVENVYAAGDCVELKCAITGKPLYKPLGSLANRMGRVAANVIAGKDDSFGPVVGASCLKVFDMNVAAVGPTAKKAAEEGFDVGQSWGYFTDKPDYYPEFENISAKMVFDRKTQRILGVQAVSKGEAIRRIDAATTMIREGMTLRRVWDFEPAYAPPYADVIDPLHYLSFIGVNSIEEGVTCFPPLELEERASGAVVIDVREEFEVANKSFSPPCKALLNIPFTQLRSRISELPKNERLVVVCSRGSRSSEAVRILKQHGFEDVQYMGGGFGFFND